MSRVKNILLGAVIILGMYVVIYFGVTYQLTSSVITTASEGERRWTLGDHLQLVLYNLGLRKDPPEAIEFVLGDRGDDSIWYDEGKREQLRQELQD